MVKHGLVTGLLVGALALGGCKSAPPPSANADKDGAPTPSEPAKVEYFPLVPKVEWQELNALQKTTAAITIVPGCVLSALANTYLWATQGTSCEFKP